MNIINVIYYAFKIITIRPRRYSNLLRIIFQNKCKNIIEIGTFDGRHAFQMIKVASSFHPTSNIKYYGFDLFEQLTKEKFEEEYSKFPPPYSVVSNRLRKTGANIRLYIGDSGEKLIEYKDELKEIDLVFIDGGHAIATIELDWLNVQNIMSDKTIVIFDDYYYNDEDQIKGYGCNQIIDNLDPQKYKIEILEPTDKFKKDWGILKVNMVKVGRK